MRLAEEPPVEAIRDIINGLSVSQRDALLLVCRDGLSYQDAADHLELPLPELVQDLVTARKTLIDALHLTL